MNEADRVPRNRHGGRYPHQDAARDCARRQAVLCEPRRRPRRGGGGSARRCRVTSPTTRRPWRAATSRWSLVALPPAAHLEWTLRALAAGKHVIVEKPPFLHAADFDEVVSAASAGRRQVLVAENYFYKPLAALLRTIVQGGDVGEIRFIHLNALKAQPTGNWRDDPPLAGGGALFEGGIHWVSLLANIGLTPSRIHAALPGAGQSADRNAAVTLEYAGGRGGDAALLVGPARRDQRRALLADLRHVGFGLFRDQRRARRRRPGGAGGSRCAA